MRRFAPLVVLAAWAGFVLGTQRWVSVADAVAEGWGGDAVSYIAIARAAPSFPDRPVRRAFAERFPAHWLAGVVADATGIPLEDVYRALTLLLLASLLAVVHATLRAIGLGARGRALVLGALVATAYPVHFLLAASAFVADGVFLLGLAVALLGFVRRRLPLVVGGLVLATLGRQTAVPAALAAAAWIAYRPAFPALRWRSAAAVALAPLAAYAVLRAVADTFAFSPETPGARTAIGYLTSAHALGEHVGKTALGVAVPAALVVAAWLRTRGSLPWVPLVLAAAVLAQPLVLGPASLHPGNEPRVAALAAPALATAAALLLRRAVLGVAELALLAAAIALASLHPRYAHAPWGSDVWAVLQAVAAVAIVAVLGRRGREPS